VERGRHKTSMEWPVAVDERLRLLVALVEQAPGAGATSASELVAALICEQPLDGALLAGRVVHYRQTAPADIVAATHAYPALTAAAPRRGRPRRSSGRGLR
jgi:hypothetical protein